MYDLRANMKSVSILPLAIVLATASAIGQDTVLHRSANPASLTLSSPLTPRADCPVGLQEQRIQLTMTNPSPKEIVSAQITVHGFSDKWRAIPLAGATDSPDLTKRVNVVLNVKGNNHASSDLSLDRFTSVAYVDLNSLTYADGATWQASSPGACSVTPNPFMLVSAAR
jgi:hypothetical protein